MSEIEKDGKEVIEDQLAYEATEKGEDPAPAEATPAKKPKKARTPKQEEAFKKCQEARAAKAKAIRESGTMQPPKVKRDHVYHLQTDIIQKQDEFMGKMNHLFDEFSKLRGMVTEEEGEAEEPKPKKTKGKKAVEPEPIPEPVIGRTPFPNAQPISFC